MWEKLQGKTKIAIAKEKMTELIRALPPSTRIGLEVYGHREKGNCEDIEILVPPGQGDKDTLIRRLNAITAKGQTPITRALRCGKVVEG
jgi:Ca-activated chloride channel family protein